MPSKIVVPELGESILEATVGRWLKNVGEPVAVGEPVVELETEKVDLEVGAEKGGVLARIEKRQGEDVKIGDVLGVIEEGASAAASAKAAAGPGLVEAERPGGEPRVVSIESGLAPKGDPGPRASAPAGDVPATPSARRVAREHGIDLAEIPGRDSGDRVTAEDVESYAEARGDAGSAAPS